MSSVVENVVRWFECSGSTCLHEPEGSGNRRVTESGVFPHHEESRIDVRNMEDIAYKIKARSEILKVLIHSDIDHAVTGGATTPKCIGSQPSKGFQTKIQPDRQTIGEIPISKRGWKVGRGCKSSVWS